MSGFVGIFNRDGRPVGGDRVVRRMLDAIAFRGPDASHVWMDGPVALGHCLLRTTPESVDEWQPHHLRDEGLSIVFDGRIDNREELLERFDRERVSPTADFDAAFALTAYQLWGEECPAQLLGDFAFVVWDARRRRLFCARDVLGLKPFYYHRTPDLFLFASEPQALLRHPAVSRRPNEGMVGEYLSVVTSVEDTLFADIQRLPPASRLSVSADRCRLDKHWEIEPTREIRYTTVAEYGEHLRSLVSEAIRGRLRSCSKVAVMLSGGVDSSSILGLATSLVRQGAVDTNVVALSLVAPEGVVDESPYIDQVVAMHGCRAHKFPGDSPPPAEYRRAARLRADVPPWPNGRLACALKQGARQSGVRVLLTGLWGDEWFGGSYYYCADLFRSMRWLALVEKVRTQSRVLEVTVPGPLLKVMIWPLLSRAMRRHVKRLIGRDGMPSWIRRDFAQRIGLADRLYPIDPDPAFPTIAQRDIHRTVTSGLATLATEEEERTAAEFGVETRHPFADRRIMEFGMAIPEDLRWRDGVRKFILREAMREYLPDEVRCRLTSADAAPIFVPPLRGFLNQGLLDAPAIERQGWVDFGEARALCADMLDRHANGDATYADAIWPLWSIAGVEIWMQEVVDRTAIEEDSCEKTLTRV